jgi:EAL domain-containing protein (putative c-di-GMP-specific phosphodiesterase class I)
VGVTLVLAPSSAAVLDRLASLASVAGYDHRIEGPLLVVGGRAEALDELLARCAASVSPGEAATTRVVWLDLDLDAASAWDVLATALAADTLAAVAARAAHGAMLDALDAGRGVETAYQPIIDMRSGQTIAFEALLRLEHAGRSVPPLDVFRAAAETGRLSAADAAARRAAIRGATGWIGRRSLFLNLLPASIERPEDLDATATEVHLAGFEPGQIVFETSVLDDDARHLDRVLAHIRMRGFGISLDDVSDDPDALRLVEQVRPETVKIASSVVADLPGLQARAAVATVVGVAHAIGARVVAKGIENPAQLDAVLFVGVDDAQGWQVGQPMRPPSGRAAVAS